MAQQHVQERGDLRGFEADDTISNRDSRFRQYRRALAAAPGKRRHGERQQALVLIGVGLAAWRARASLRAGVALAAIAPVLFLLLNRVFSPQYLVLMLAAWAIAGALLVESRREQLALGVAVMAATTANAFVYPYTLHELGLWRLASALLFAVGLVTSAWLVWRSLSIARGHEGSASLDSRSLATFGRP